LALFDSAESEQDGSVAVITIHRLVGKASIDLVDGQNYRLFLLGCYNDFDDTEASYFMLVTDCRSDEIITEIVDRCNVEKLVIILKRHPEAAIVCVSIVDLRLALFGPQWRLV
jgi:hypothetical protein